MNRILGILLISTVLALTGVFVAAQIDLNTFSANTPILASEVNENFEALKAEIEALQSGGAGIPAGAVMAFNRSSCPAGWSVLEEARGRFIVGMPDGGTLAGTAGGSPLTDLEDRVHLHSVDIDPLFTSAAGNHNHLWAEFTTGLRWRDGNGATIIDWGDGIDNEGADIYPLAIFPAPATTQQFFTDNSGDHEHQVDIGTNDSSSDGTDLPYLQLLTCEKD